MSDFIFYSGIVTFCILLVTTLLAFLRKRKKWHKILGYSCLIVALVHGGVAIYRAIKLYIAYL